MTKYGEELDEKHLLEYGDYLLSLSALDGLVSGSFIKSNDALDPIYSSVSYDILINQATTEHPLRNGLPGDTESIISAAQTVASRILSKPKQAEATIAPRIIDALQAILERGMIITSSPEMSMISDTVYARGDKVTYCLVHYRVPEYMHMLYVSESEIVSEWGRMFEGKLRVTWKDDKLAAEYYGQAANKALSNSFKESVARAAALKKSGFLSLPNSLEAAFDTYISTVTKRKTYDRVYSSPLEDYESYSRSFGIDFTF